MPDNPYRGLECFEAEHAALYFGRERAARELLERLEDHPLVALIGVVGSGKSSLVRAGLPGAQVVEPGEPLPMPGSGRLVLVVDQFERLLPADPEIDRVLELARRNVRVVLAVCAEAYAQMLAHPGLAAAIEPFTLPPMTHRDLMRAIEEPARRSGCAFEPGLAERNAKLAAIAFSPDGRTLAGAEAGGAIRLWDVATRRLLGAPLAANGPTELAFSPDNRELVAGGTPLQR